jgi:hypothetical protein
LTFLFLFLSWTLTSWHLLIDISLNPFPSWPILTWFFYLTFLPWRYRLDPSFFLFPSFPLIFNLSFLTFHSRPFLTLPNLFYTCKIFAEKIGTTGCIFFKKKSILGKFCHLEQITYDYKLLYIKNEHMLARTNTDGRGIYDF